MTNNHQHRSVTTAIVQAVAEREGVDPDTLPPLMETVHTEALNNLVERSEKVSSTSQVEVMFQYHGYAVTVKTGEDITLESLSG